MCTIALHSPNPCADDQVECAQKQGVLDGWHRLVASHADLQPDHQAPDGRTALILAVERNHEVMVEALLKILGIEQLNVHAEVACGGGAPGTALSLASASVRQLLMAHRGAFDAGDIGKALLAMNGDQELEQWLSEVYGAWVWLWLGSVSLVSFLEGRLAQGILADPSDAVGVGVRLVVHGSGPAHSVPGLHSSRAMGRLC